jgi:hypothetical protein
MSGWSVRLRGAIDPHVEWLLEGTGRISKKEIALVTSSDATMSRRSEDLSTRIDKLICLQS